MTDTFKERAIAALDEFAEIYPSFRYEFDLAIAILRALPEDDE